MMITNDVYDFLKRIAMIVLPVIGVLIFTLSLICGFSFGHIVVGIIMVAIMTIGIFIERTTHNFNATVDQFDDEPMLCDTEAD